jgi:hypothetical protein
MDDEKRLEAKGLARAKIRAKRRRVATIRRRTLRGSLALFAGVWAIVFGQLVSGNDPALSSAPKQAAHGSVASTEPRPAPEPEPSDEDEPAFESEPEVVPEEEFAPEAEPVEEEFVEVEPEAAPEPEPEPEPVVTASS